MFKTVGSKQASSWDASAQQTLLCAMPVKTIWCHHNNRRTARVISYYLGPLLTTNTKFVDFVENEVSVALRSLPMSLLHVTVIGVGNAVSERRGKNWSCSIPWSKTDHFLRARNMHGRAQGESRQLSSYGVLLALLVGCICHSRKHTPTVFLVGCGLV